jgi:hypothetical protein
VTTLSAGFVRNCASNAPGRMNLGDAPTSKRAWGEVSSPLGVAAIKLLEHLVRSALELVVGRNRRACT